MITPLAAPLTDVSDTRLVVAAVLGIAAVVLLIVVAKLHPFIALMLGTAVMGAAAAVAPLDIVDSFLGGFGDTVGNVGLLIALGAMIGALLADSGGADTIVDTIIGRVGARGLPWAMALIAAILGLPLFFEVGVVRLVPVVILVARRTDSPLMRVGIPALAGLSILHGLVPRTRARSSPSTRWAPTSGSPCSSAWSWPCPPSSCAARCSRGWSSRGCRSPPRRPWAAASGTTRASPAGRAPPPLTPRTPRRTDGPSRPAYVVPRSAAAVISITLPVVLMLARAIAELTMDEDTQPRTFLEFIGTPAVALLLAVLVAMFFLGYRTGMSREGVSDSLGGGLPAIAAILLIVAAGGGFKQMLVDAGVGDVIGDWAKDSGLSVLVLGWLVAVGVRLATGSATVATITAGGIVTGIAADLPSGELSLLVLAIGCGSLFFSHVNDAGFWLVKEYFGLTVGQTIKSWSVMETAISVVGLVCVLLLDLVV